MAVVYIGDGIYRGLSSDTKPTTGLNANAVFIETDTKQVFYWTSTAWTNKHLTTAHAQASAAETVASWKVSDSTSTVDIVNASSTDAVFSPWIRAFNLDTANPGLFFYAYIGNALDTGAEAGMRLDVRKQDNTALATRPLFSFRNAGTEVFNIGQTSFGFANKDLANVGNVTITDAKNVVVGSTTGTKIGTATTQKIGFFNATPVVQPAANPDTSDGLVATLQTEVNELKALLRSLGLMAP